MMRKAPSIFGVLAALTMTEARTQTPYPDLTLQDLAWTSGIHHYAVTQKIISPSTPELPVEISGTADAEFVSGTEVRLRPGFHAGGFANAEDGRFRARIDDTLGPPGDLVVIAPHPGSSIVDNVVQVPKWEKFEIGLRLPEVYVAAIDSFFQHFYGNSNDPYLSTPGNVVPLHDLNPYADDSLQVVMTLTSPTGQQRMKWGFYMREARWSNTAASGVLAPAHPTHPHAHHNFRFRFAPDEEGDWSFALSIKAPHTSSYTYAGMPELSYTGHAFRCVPAPSGNHGYLRADNITRRLLRFDDGTPFFGLGVNMADWRRNHSNFGNQFRFRDFDEMRKSMVMLHEMGGNFMRMFLMDKIFSPQQVHLGVFDAYQAPRICTLSESTNSAQTDCDVSWISGVTGNAQYQAWAFDSLLNVAHRQQVYIQLCIDPYSFPAVAYEKLGWGANPFVKNYLDPFPRPYDLRRFFYANGNSDSTSTGSFYYWKRKYKYIMSRWGYSVNLAIIEPFNEIDQMLTYCPEGQTADSLGSGEGVPDCSMANDEYIWNRSICRENRMNWPRNPQLPATVSQWFTDMTHYVRGTQNFEDPANSSLGEGPRPFLASYAGGGNYTDQSYYEPFRNPDVDLLSVHHYMGPRLQDTGKADAGINYAFRRAEEFRENYPTSNAPAHQRKPFGQGEHAHSTWLRWGPKDHEIEKYFHNYDVSFHNEIWASAFSGKFATGMTWHWERVFWWTGALDAPPPQTIAQNPFQQVFSNVLGAPNTLNVGGNPTTIVNRRLHHHFRPLADLLAHPSWQVYNFFDGHYTVHKVFDENDAIKIEAYYLKNADNNVAIGWVHNRNAWVMNSYYLASGSQNQNFLGCVAPNTQSIALTGFEQATDYYITWFPTRMNTTVCPDDEEDLSGTGTITLDLSTAPLGGTLNNYLDTLHADYAFIITPAPFVKSMFFASDDELPPAEAGWDYTLYPNPARDALFLRFVDDAPKNIAVLDVAGRLVASQTNITAGTHYMPLGLLAKGAYWVCVTDGENMKVKKLIIH